MIRSNELNEKARSDNQRRSMAEAQIDFDKAAARADAILERIDSGGSDAGAGAALVELDRAKARLDAVTNPKPVVQVHKPQQQPLLRKARLR